MARNTENLSPVTGAVTPELREALEEYRWKNRKTVSEVVRGALETWAKGEGIWSDEKPEGESEDTAEGESEDTAKGDEKPEDEKPEDTKTDAAKPTRNSRAGK